jgi:predicted metal-binding membrane protein
MSSAVLGRIRPWDIRDSALAATLTAVAALCWTLSAHRMRGMDMGPGTDPGQFSWFLATWATMMGAMMLPSALPAVVSFERTRRTRVPIVPGLVFTAGYLAVWTLFGAMAFLVYRGLLNAQPPLFAWDRGGRYLVATMAGAAGLYELTPMKRACLKRCRTVDGRGQQTLIAALRHGAYCVGCSVTLMILLLTIGVMRTTWMVVVAVILIAQKVPSAGPRLLPVSAVGLVALGAVIAVDPAWVPGLKVPM